jgi:hypothetical protein
MFGNRLLQHDSFFNRKTSKHLSQIAESIRMRPNSQDKESVERVGIIVSRRCSIRRHR